MLSLPLKGASPSLAIPYYQSEEGGLPQRHVVLAVTSGLNLLSYLAP